MALVVLGTLSTLACGGSTPPASDPSGSGTSPDPNTTGPGAGEPTDADPAVGQTHSDTTTQNKTTGGDGVTPDSGAASPGAGPGVPGH